ncbi:putative T6SS immunity periplasmic lipoprotein [Pantoea sp. FN0302]|uniref:putative T6SS immunity periplasmic lipoprotein n=1 Tax=unclassified Pantoea TaxID=2630326 RepID=UPI003CF7D0A8
MRKLLFIAAALLLSGCPGPGDYFHPDYPAQVTIKDNKPCVTVQPEGDEEVYAIHIYEMAGMAREKLFIPKSYTVRADECLDIAAYPFRLDTAYVFSVVLSSEKKFKKKHFPWGRGFVTRFRLSEGAHGLQVEEVEPEPPNWNLPARSSDEFELISPEQQ